jgi:hypothetical protein
VPRGDRLRAGAGGDQPAHPPAPAHRLPRHDRHGPLDPPRANGPHDRGRDHAGDGTSG